MSLRTLMLVLAAASFAQLAPSCGGGSGGGGGGVPTATLGIEPSAISIGQGSFFSVDVQISASAPVQAYNLTLAWDPTRVSVISFDPHGDFDDDGSFFGTAVLKQQSGTLSRIIDLRHGIASGTSEVSVATVWFFAGSPGQSAISVSGKAAGSDGTKFSTVATSPANVTVNGS